ncbi:hypothetical protein [Plesiomonas sp.]|uniref:hypothetical protein n=1 Tax=Plesiomonas sp. TaxID=2486279 RepID=UPI003F2ED851
MRHLLLRPAEIKRRSECCNLIFRLWQDSLGQWFAQATVADAEFLGRFTLSRTRGARTARHWRDLDCCIRFLRHHFKDARIEIC